MPIFVFFHYLTVKHCKIGGLPFLKQKSHSIPIFFSMGSQNLIFYYHDSAFDILPSR